MGSRLNVQLRTHWPALVFMLVAVLGFALVGAWAGQAGAVDPPVEGLQHQGFEEFDVGEGYFSEWPPAAWEIPDDGSAAVVGAADWGDFPIYATMEVLAPPYNEDYPDEDQFLAVGGGSYTLRLGVPKDKDSHQIKGPVSVWQEFQSDGRGLSLVYRLFSWENKSEDAFVIELCTLNGTPAGQIADSTRTGYYEVFPQNPVKPDKFWFSQWTDVSITGLEPGETYRLTYTLSNAQDAAHDTWVYVDHVNHAPVAQFEWASISPDEPPHEGDVIGLYGDWSYDPDPDGYVVRWRWEITNKDNETVFFNDVTPLNEDPDEYDDFDFLCPVGFIVPPDGDDTYTVKLTVWDNEGLPDTSEAKQIEVKNYAPRVNALNIEVLPSATGQFVGRFVDPGWWDNHKATWSLVVDGNVVSSVPGGVDEDHLAVPSSGHVSGTVTGGSPGQTTDWILAVDDYEGGIGYDEFTVSVIEPDPQLNEPEQPLSGDLVDDPDVFPSNVPLSSDGAYLSYIQSQGDVDIFEVKLDSAGKLLPMGTELLVTLGDLPANYDLIVFEGVEGSGVGDTESPQAAPFTKSQFQPAAFMNSGFMNSGFMNSGFMNSAFMNSGFMNSGFMNSAFMNSGFMNSGFMNSGFMNSGFMNSPFDDSVFVHSAFMNSAFMNSGFMNSGFMNSPIDGYPLSEMSFTGTEHDNTSGTDVSFDELGLDLEALPQDGEVQELRVLGFSANSGAEDEVVLATTGYPQTGEIKGHVYVAVKSATGAYSTSAPYTLQIETSSPLDPLAVGLTSQGPVVPVDQVTEKPEVIPYSNPDDQDDKALTLFVTQFERLANLYPAEPPGEPNGGEVVRRALLKVASRADVKGTIISVPANLYADYVDDTGWDDKPWLVERANKVASSIRELIQTQLALDVNSDIQYVVLVGNDRVIPLKRLIDQTIIGNEQNYADQSFLSHYQYESDEWVSRPSATLASIANGYILTDDYYVDAAPISWGGSYLYIPDLAVSRLVETPEEIERTIEAFIDVDGTLSPDMGLVSGYDFMANGAQNVREILSGAGLGMPDDVVDLIGESWHGDDLTRQLFDGDDASDIDVANINAHFTHFAGLSPPGYADSVAGTLDDVSELLLSRDIAEAKDSLGNDLFKGKLVFSMGCHAGLNVPDKEVVELSAGSPITPALDFPQAMMKQGGIYLGSTGFGYGDTVGIAGTEALIGFFAQQLVGGADLAGAVPVGLALTQAKQEYLGSLSSLTPYDQKSSVQFTLYGMPQYDLSTEVLLGQGASAPSVSLAAAGETACPDSFLLHLSESSMEDDNWEWQVPTLPYELSLNTSETGYYITADGMAEATPDRPIHPIAAIHLDPRDPPDSGPGPAHGFVYKGGSYFTSDSCETLPDPFQPAIARATTEWDGDNDEFQVATSEFWPVEPGSLTTRETGDETDNGGYDQTFIAVPAQFKATPDKDPIEGTERVWSSLDVEVLRSTDTDDWTAPTVTDVDISWTDTTGLLDVSVEAHDSGGISRIVVVQLGPDVMYIPGVNGDKTFVSTPEDDRYELTGLALTYGEEPEDVALLIQVVDDVGNVTRLTGRGGLFGVRQPFNLGFEYGLNFWDPIVEPVPENASTVPREDDPADDQTEPYTGQQMLRLGTPTDKDAHQVKGVTSVSQYFQADGGIINVVYLLQTDDTRDWEFDDVFTIAVKDASENTTYWAEVRNTQVTNEWEPVDITGLIAGDWYTLTYTLDTTNSAAKNTWVYVDKGD